jgi:hypothetical protein
MPCPQVSALLCNTNAKNPLPRQGSGLMFETIKSDLLAATEDQGESTEAEQGGGGGLWDGFGIKTDVVP